MVGHDSWKREQSGAPNARVCGFVPSAGRLASAIASRRRSTACGRTWRSSAAPAPLPMSVKAYLGPARPVTDSLKSQSSTRDHPYEHVIFPNKLMKQRCPDMSHQGERQGQADHALCSANILSENDLSDGQMGGSSNIQSTMMRAP